MIDLHCHLLPGIDDGPASLGPALTIAQLQLAAGVHTVAATPHVSPAMRNDAAGIAARLEELRVALRAAKIPLEVTSGAEVDLPLSAELSDDELRALSLGASGWVLAEAPLGHFPFVRRAVEQVLARGHRVVLAHPERSPSLHGDLESVRRLAAAGVVMQITATSLTGRFGGTVQRFAARLLEEGLVHVIASDAHDGQQRPPGLRDPLREAGIDGELAEILTDRLPAALLAGKPLPAVPALPRQRGALRSLLHRR